EEAEDEAVGGEEEWWCDDRSDEQGARERNRREEQGWRYAQRDSFLVTVCSGVGGRDRDCVTRREDRGEKSCDDRGRGFGAAGLTAHRCGDCECKQRGSDSAQRRERFGAWRKSCEESD